MHTYRYHGTGPIHTPSGVVDHGGTFESGPDWVSAHPQRRWLKMGLITLEPVKVEEEPKKSVKRGK